MPVYAADTLLGSSRARCVGTSAASLARHRDPHLHSLRFPRLKTWPFPGHNPMVAVSGVGLAGMPVGAQA